MGVLRRSSVLVMASQVAMARARGGHGSRFLMPMGAVSTWEKAPVWLMLQRFSRGAGDGNRTRTVSLGTARTHGYVLGSLGVSRS